jgi:hypothetical protein
MWMAMSDAVDGHGLLWWLLPASSVTTVLGC